MSNKHVDANLSQADADRVLASIADIRSTLAFLIDLNADERRNMVKFGDKSQSFVTKAAALMDQHPEILPPNFNVDAFRKQVALLDALYPLQLALQHLFGQIGDTIYAAGSDAYSSALQVYTYAKAANMYNGSLEGALEDLGRRFAHHNHADPATAVKPS